MVFTAPMRVRYVPLVAIVLAGATMFNVLGGWAMVKEVLLYAGYLTRPIWDFTRPTTDPPHTIIPNYGFVDGRSCARHGFEVRAELARVWDIFLFANEIDMLEIRLNELFEVVDQFIIIESHHTFTGQPKPLFYKTHVANKARFSRFLPKISHVIVPIDSHFTFKGKTPNHFERFQREYGATYVYEHLGFNLGDLYFISDVDEIPRSDTVRLLKHCTGFPDIRLQLQMRQFRYSYEFPFGTMDRPSVNVFVGLDDKGHFSCSHMPGGSKFALGDSGWHCSFCFRELEDFVFKMHAYSHADRVRFSSHEDLVEIQKKICAGTDLFNMLPEAYTFRDLVRFSDPTRKWESTEGLPKFLRDPNQHERFSFLLPGNENCIRTSQKRRQAAGDVDAKQQKSQQEMGKARWTPGMYG